MADLPRVAAIAASSPASSPIESGKSKGISRALVAKIIIVVLLVLALATATFFSGGAALPLFALAGGVSLKVGIAAIGTLGLAITTLTAALFAVRFNMFKDTAHNMRDCVRYVTTFGLMGLSGFLSFL